MFVSKKRFEELGKIVNRLESHVALLESKSSQLEFESLEDFVKIVGKDRLNIVAETKNWGEFRSIGRNTFDNAVFIFKNPLYSSPIYRSKSDVKKALEEYERGLVLCKKGGKK